MTPQTIPDSRETGLSGDRELTAQWRTRGQVVIMFALFLGGLMGMLGLATDLGVAFAQRRTMQNAADAGAVAGARVVLRSSTTTPLSASSDVTTLAQANHMNTTPSVSSCTYVNDANGSVGSCSGNVPSTATGVNVSVQETHNTFFIQVIPGAPDSVTVHASAIAHVQKWTGMPADGPFLVCGVGTQLSTSGTMNILTKSGSTWVANESADQQTFIIHGPKIEKCKAQASRYKGVSDQDANRSRTIPPEQWFNYKEGDTAGPVSADVPGVQGCKAGQVVDNCVAFLPMVVDTPAETGNNKQLWTVAFLPFYITEPKSNEHNGKLLLHYEVTGSSSSGWSSGYLGAAVIRLTG